MKKLLYSVLLLGFLSSCSVPCTSDVLGVYEGKCFSELIDEAEDKISISQSIAGDFNVLLTNFLIGEGALLIEGTINETCSTIDIPLQFFDESFASDISLEGSLNINEDQLTGEITVFIYGNLLVTCSYDMIKI